MAKKVILLLLAAFALATAPACGRGAAGLSEPDPRMKLEAQLQGNLAEELQRLGIDPARAVSRPPSGGDNLVDDLRLEQSGGGWALRWSYRNLGDYNQNGTVGVEDITPLAQHFGASVGAEDPLVEVIDGNGNGAVGIEDVTPIAANFGAELSGYVVETTTSLPPDCSDYAEVPIASFTDAGGRLLAELQMDVLPARYFRLSAYDREGERSVVSEVFAVELPGPEITAVRPLTCATGLAAVFAADVSGEGRKQFSWDFGGEALPVASDEETPAVIFSSPGAHSCSVTVVTPFGIDSEDFQVWVVEPGTSPYVLDVQPESGLAGTMVTFTADADGDAPLLYSWDFHGAVAPGERYSSAVSPEVTLVGTPGNYPVTLTVANAHGSDNYEFSFTVIEGLEMRVESIRVLLVNVENTTPGSLYQGTSFFAPLLSTEPNEGGASAGTHIAGELDAVYYVCNDTEHYGFDDPPPAGKEAAYDATFTYLSQLLEWSVELAGYSEDELITRDEMEPPGRLWGTLGDILDVYTVTAVLPPSPFAAEGVELVVLLEVSSP